MAERERLVNTTDLLTHRLIEQGFDIEPVMKKWRGWWSDKTHGLVHFNTVEDARSFVEEIEEIGKANTAPDFTIDLKDTNLRPIPNEAMRPLLKRFNGTWYTTERGIVAFTNQGDADGFLEALKDREAEENAERRERATEFKAGKSRAPTNLQALDMIEKATQQAKHAKWAKEYFDKQREEAIKHSKIKVEWGSNTEQTSAMWYIDAAFKEYLPEIFDVARKKAEEADREAREQLKYWGDKA